MAEEPDALVKALRRLDKAVKKHNSAMPVAVRTLKQQLSFDREMLSPDDLHVAARAVTEYVDAIDFMCVMWERLKTMTQTRHWEVHSELLARTLGEASALDLTTVNAEAET